MIQIPNHCSNSLTVTGPDAPAFFAAVADGSDDDFINTLVPMPEELRTISTGGCTIDGERVTEWREVGGKNVKITEIDRQHIIDLHGTVDWYTWAREHWGTKWSAYDVSIDHDAKTINFDSAWSPPQAAIDTISSMFPNATFTLAFAEGGSCFWGHVVFENGSLLHSEEWSDFWDDMAAEDDDPMDSVLPEVREHLEKYGLHTGG